MKKKYMFTMFLSIIIGVGVGLIGVNAWIRNNELNMCSVYSRIQPDGGHFKLTFRTATPLDGQILYLWLDGELFAEVEIPNSGSWTGYIDAVADDIVIPACPGGELHAFYDPAQLDCLSLSVSQVAN